MNEDYSNKIVYLSLSSVDSRATFTLSAADALSEKIIIFGGLIRSNPTSVLIVRLGVTGKERSDESDVVAESAANLKNYM